jgi:UDP-N-acetylglucosamine 4-epimerase
VYGDDPTLPKREERLGSPLSPYAASKWMNEIYAEVCERCYGLVPVGLRYFNVFGPRQDPTGAYAAVIPCWFAALAAGEPVYINGDGETSRDFCYIANVVQANLLAATVDVTQDGARAPATEIGTPAPATEDGAPAQAAETLVAQTLAPDSSASGSLAHPGRVFNVAVGARTTLNELFAAIRERVARERPECAASRPVYREFRAGDVRHSLADISRARSQLGFHPTHSLEKGLDLAAPWYLHTMKI